MQTIPCLLVVSFVILSGLFCHHSNTTTHGAIYYLSPNATGKPDFHSCCCSPTLACNSFFQIFNQAKETNNSKNMTIYLLGSGNGDGLIYSGRDYCSIFPSANFPLQLTVQSFDSNDRAVFNCTERGGIFISKLDQLNFVDLDFYGGIAGTSLGSISFKNCSFSEFGFEALPAPVKFVDSVIRNSWVKYQNSFSFENSQLINVDIRPYFSKVSNVDISIVNCNVIGLVFNSNVRIQHWDIVPATFNIIGSTLSQSSIDTFLFNNATIQNSSFYSTPIKMGQSETVIISNCLFVGATSVILEFTSSVIIEQSTFNNISQTKTGATILVNIGYKFLMKNCKFNQNSNTCCKILGLPIATISSCTFTNNIQAISADLNDLSTFEPVLSISDSTFSNNVNQGNGGAVMALGASILYVYLCGFYNNSALNGGALYASQIITTDISSNFVGNNALAKGGAIYFRRSNELSTDQTLMDLNCNFKSNSATFGGGIYTPNIGSYFRRIHVECEGNSASFSGGCIFSEILLSPWLVSQFHEKGPNIANSYGSFIGYSLQNISVSLIFTRNGVVTQRNNTTPNVSLYAGEKIDSISLTVYDFNMELVKSLYDKIFVTLDNPNYSVEYESNSISNKVLNSFFIKSISNDTSMNVDIITASIVIDSLNSVNMTITLVPCPKNYILSSTYSTSGYLCVAQSVIPYEVIIPIVVIVTTIAIFILIALFIILIYGIKIIVKKLRTLERKERAEKAMELVMSRLESTNTEMKEQLSSLLSNNYLQVSQTDKRYIIPVEQIEIIKRIGEGSCGTVFLGKWNGTDVAVKTLKLDQNDTENEEFEKEAALLSSLRHPNIVNFYGISITDDRKYMIVEYLPKGSLDGLIAKSRRGIERMNILQKLDILLGRRESTTIKGEESAKEKKD